MTKDKLPTAEKKAFQQLRKHKAKHYPHFAGITRPSQQTKMLCIHAFWGVFSLTCSPGKVFCWMIFDAAARAGKIFRQFLGQLWKIGRNFFWKAARPPKTHFLQQKNT